MFENYIANKDYINTDGVKCSIIRSIEIKIMFISSILK